jgi:hypothetical protein
MSKTTNANRPTVNTNLFNENTSKFPYEEWAKLVGRQIAWSLDGTKIIASGQDYAQLLQVLNDRGIPISEVVLDYVPTEDEETVI